MLSERHAPKPDTHRYFVDFGLDELELQRVEVRSDEEAMRQLTDGLILATMFVRVRAQEEPF